MKEKEIKKYNSLIVFIVGIFIFMGISFKVLFPVFAVNSEDKNKFFLYSIGEKKYLELKIKKGYPFHKITMKVDFSDKIKDSNFFGNIYQNEVGLYSLGEEINNEENLNKFLRKNNNSKIRNGELIAKGDAVYFISDGQYRPFMSAEIFDMLGFDWQKVERNKAEELTNLVEGEKITEKTHYLSGMFVKINGKVYLLDGNHRHLINGENKELIEFIEKNFSLVSIDSDKTNSIGRFKCHQTIGMEFECSFEDIDDKVLPWASLIIEVKDNSVEEAKIFAKIYSYGKLNLTVPKITLKNIRTILSFRYKDYLNFSK